MRNPTHPSNESWLEWGAEKDEALRAAQAEVERLREHGTQLLGERDLARQQREEARGQCERLRICYATATAAEGKLQAENARLRAALAVFANRENWLQDGIYVTWDGETGEPWNIAQEPLRKEMR